MTAAANAAIPSRLQPRWVVASVAVLVVAVALGLALGPVAINPFRSLYVILGHVPFVHVHSGLTPQQAGIVWELRLPRVVLGVLVGAMLASSGAAYQGVFRNPLADPYLLGAAAGAGLGVTLVITSGNVPNGGLLDPAPLAAFAGALAAAFLAYAIGAIGGRLRTPATLLLAGVAVMSFLTALQTYVQQRHADTIRTVYDWILGRLTTASWSDVVLVLPYFVITSVVLVTHARHARRARSRRRGGRESRGSGPARTPHRCRRRLARDRGRGVGERAHRLRRHHRAAHDPARRGNELPHHPPPLVGVRRRVPRACRPRGAHHPLAVRDPDRRRDRRRRRAVLRRRAPDQQGNRRMTAAISCREISVVVDESTLLDGVSFDVDTNEWVCVLGPNGAGKTTLLRAIIGALATATGEIALMGRPVSEMRSRERARFVAVVPQVPLIPPGMRVLDYVLLGRTPHHGMLSSIDTHDVEIAHDALADLELEVFADRRVDSLSGGERQRVIVAAGARAAGAGIAARRADRVARHRPSAGRPRARRPAPAHA